MSTAILLKKKAKCDTKALQIVEKLIEPGVDIEWMLGAIGQINRTHLEDVAEERAIEKICGYVLCDNKLKIVTKKYHISTLKNKVYDVEKMKNFCSFTCYSAMNYLMMQIPTSPLWLRAEEDIPKFTIIDKLEKRPKSPPGIEINITGMDLSDEFDILEEEEKEEEEESEKNDNDNVKTNKKIKIEGHSHEAESISPRNEIEPSSSRSEDKQDISKNEINTEKISINNGNINKLADKNDYNQESQKKDSNSSSTMPNKLIENSNGEKIVNIKDVPIIVFDVEKVNKISESAISTINDKKLNYPSQESIEKTVIAEKKIEKKKWIQNSVIFTETLAARLERCFDEWVTKDTYNFLHEIMTKENDMIKKNEFNDKYIALCKRIDQRQFEDDVERKSFTISESLRPAPHYAVLKEQAKELEIKARTFYSGQLETEVSLNNSNKEENDQESGTAIPLTDARTPNALRRRVFLDKLNKILPDVLRTLTGSNQIEYLYTAKCMSSVKTLISTFNLTANNIVFKTAEWTLVSLLVINLLGLIDSKIEALLSTKDPKMYMSMILMAYQLDSEYINNLLKRFTI